MSKEKYTMQQVGAHGDSERYMLMPTLRLVGQPPTRLPSSSSMAQIPISSVQARWVMLSIRLSPSMGEIMSISTMAMTMTCLMSCSASFA